MNFFFFSIPRRPVTPDTRFFSFSHGQARTRARTLVPENLLGQIPCYLPTLHSSFSLSLFLPLFYSLGKAEARSGTFLFRIRSMSDWARGWIKSHSHLSINLSIQTRLESNLCVPVLLLPPVISSVGSGNKVKDELFSFFFIILILPPVPTYTSHRQAQSSLSQPSQAKPGQVRPYHAKLWPDPRPGEWVDGIPSHGLTMWHCCTVHERGLGLSLSLGSGLMGFTGKPRRKKAILMFQSGFVGI